MQNLHVNTVLHIMYSGKHAINGIVNASLPVGCLISCLS